MNENKNTAAQPLDLDKLEALARAATPGPWAHPRFGALVAGPMQKFVNGEGQEQIAMTTGTSWMRKDESLANADFIAAANPQTILALIAQARASQPEGAAPSGFKLVPLEPTHLMIGAGARAQLNSDAGQQANSLTMAKAAYAAMISAAPALTAQTGVTVDEAARLRKVLIDVRNALQFANDSPGGGINGTIWMMHTPEMLFDFIDAALAQPEGATGTTGASVKTWQERMGPGYIDGGADLPEEVAMKAEIADLRAQLAAKCEEANAWSERWLKEKQLAAKGQGEPVAWMVDRELFISHDAIPPRLLPPLGNPIPLVPASAQPDRGAAQFDHAKFMQMVREFAEVCYGVRRSTEDVGKNLIDYVKSLAAPSPASQPVAPAKAQAAFPPELPKFMPGMFSSMEDCWNHAVLSGWRAAVAPSDAKDATMPDLDILPSHSEIEAADMERDAFSVWARTTCNLPIDVPLNWDAVWTKAAWEGWLGRVSTSSGQAQRARFEAWATRSGAHVTLSHVFSFTPHPNGGRYYDGTTELCWRAWQAAQNAQSPTAVEGKTIAAGQEAANAKDAALQFANDVIDHAFDGGDLDGGTVQEMAEARGLLKHETVAEPCGGACNCMEAGADFPTTCYRKTYMKAQRAAMAAAPSSAAGNEGDRHG